MMAAQLVELRMPDFWRGYWITMRPYLLFISGVAGMTGFATGPRIGTGVTLAVFLVFFLSYGFGQALTDCFQMDTDTLSSPYRPLVQGKISRRNVLFVSLMGLSAGSLVLFFMNPLTLVLGLFSVGGLATYTYFKKRWWAGPFYNSWIVALLPLMGKMAAEQNTHLVSFLPDYPILFLIMISVFFSYANFVLIGYFKDISADRASGYNTFVVAFGWQRAALGSDLLAFFSLVFSGWAVSAALIQTSSSSTRWLSLLVYGVAFAILIVAQISIHRTRDETKTFRPITHVVRAFILLHLAEIVAMRPEWAPYGALFYLSFELVLRNRPEKRQV